MATILKIQESNPKTPLTYSQDKEKTSTPGVKKFSTTSSKEDVGIISNVFDTGSPLQKAMLTPLVNSYLTEEERTLIIAYRTLHSSTSSSPITISFPDAFDDLFGKVIFPFQRHIESQYQALPWPSKVKKILIMTQVLDGKGDIAAAAKAIALMQRICPQTVSFDWVTQGARYNDPLSFLTREEASRVHHRDWCSLPIEKNPADFLLVGPIVGYRKDYIEPRVGRKINGPMYGFREIAAEDLNPNFSNFDSPYLQLHSLFFASQSEDYSLPMGIRPGIGVFIDQGRTQAPLSRIYCCPSYVRLIQDDALRKDILTAMQVYDDTTTPDFDKYSLNSGYAHEDNSWGKFIDCVVMHEHEKHVVIVLNLSEKSDHFSAEEFFDTIFTPQRLDLLQKKGYGSLTLKSLDNERALLLTEDGLDKRNLTVIIRPSFKPHDMKQLQLASDRLLATGDNTAIESWCARCKLYLYECFPHKVRFFKQQIDLAKTIAPALARFLECRDYNTTEFEPLLDDPELATDTLKFCHYVSEHYAFDPLLEGALKRTAWHHTIPALSEMEAETMDKEFQQDLMEYLKEPHKGKSLTLSSLPQLKERVEKTVEEHALTQFSL